MKEYPVGQHKYGTPPSNAVLGKLTYQLFLDTFEAAGVTVMELAQEDCEWVNEIVPRRFQFPYFRTPNVRVGEMVRRYRRDFMMNRELCYQFQVGTTPDLALELCIRLHPELLELSDEEAEELYKKTMKELGGVASFMGISSLTSEYGLYALCVLQLPMMRGLATDDPSTAGDETLAFESAEDPLQKIIAYCMDSDKSPIMRMFDNCNGPKLLQPGCMVGRDDLIIRSSAKAISYFTYDHLFSPQEVEANAEDFIKLVEEELKLYGYTLVDFYNSVTLPHQRKYVKPEYITVDIVADKLSNLVSKINLTSAGIKAIRFGRLIDQQSDFVEPELLGILGDPKIRPMLAFDEGPHLAHNYGLIAHTAPGRYFMKLPDILEEIARSTRVHPYRRDEFLAILCKLGGAFSAKFYYDYIDDQDAKGMSFM
jgi:hypothetical protein